MLGDVEGFGQRALHESRGAHAVGESRVVDHIRHLLETLAAFAHEPGKGAFETDFATGHRASAEFVFESQNTIVVGRPIGLGAWQKKKRDPFESVNSLGACQHHGKARVGV